MIIMLLYENKYFVEKIEIRKNMLKDLTVSLSNLQKEKNIRTNFNIVHFSELQVPSVLFFDHKIYTTGILIDVLKTLYHIFFFKQK